jgi:hypothetical protein
VASYRWSESAGRYTDARGRFVSEARVRAVIDDLADAASERMAAASQRLLAGDMSLAAWQAELQATIKLTHVSAGVLANGGAAQMTSSRWGSLGPVIRDQYAFLRQFAEQIADGRQLLNGSLTARARQYGQAGRVTFERTYSQGQQSRGYQSERNVLAPAEHCRECRALSARGWVPIGTLPPIGSRLCRSNDRCRIAYRREPAEEIAA